MRMGEYWRTSSSSAPSAAWAAAATARDRTAPETTTAISRARNAPIISVGPEPSAHHGGRLYSRGCTLTRRHRRRCARKLQRFFTGRRCRWAATVAGALVLCAAAVPAGAQAGDPNERLAAKLLKRDPGARVGGKTQVSTKPGAPGAPLQVHWCTGSSLSITRLESRAAPIVPHKVGEGGSRGLGSHALCGRRSHPGFTARRGGAARCPRKRRPAPPLTARQRRGPRWWRRWRGAVPAACRCRTARAPGRRTGGRSALRGELRRALYPRR